MFAGHVGAAMAIGRADRRINIGALTFAAVLLDVLLWLFVLAGWESVSIGAEFASTHQPRFGFAYSHGLLASLGWSALAAAISYLWARSRPEALRVMALVAAAVFSHWLLDALVHAPELPLAGEASAKVGLGLWDRMPLALGVEALIAVGGLWLFLSGSGLGRGRKIGLALLMLVVLVSTIAGMTIAPPPPSAAAMAATSIVMIALVCGLAWWLGRLR